MKNWLIKRSKKGVTVVESVFAVVILGIFATGIISLLTAGGVKIFEISSQSNAYSQAAQKMDLLIASISNGNYINTDENDLISLNSTDIATALGVTVDDVNTVTFNGDAKTQDNVRGWYLTLTYDGATVTGFASNTNGRFDSE